MMGGTVWVESQIGQGSQFHFTIRVAHASMRISPSTILAQPEVLHGVKVLIVDDNRTNRRILDGLLRHWKMRPTTVEDGEQALYKAIAACEDGEPFELILTDMHMPRMDGFDLVRRIRERPGIVTSTIMMLTSGGQRGDVRRAEELGVAAHLLKPVRQAELRGALIRALSSQGGTGTTIGTTDKLARAERSETTPLRVLLAEDNAVNQLLAVRLLEKRGHSVKVVGNGREALDALGGGTYDLVFMDVQMPEMDGIEATMALRERETITGVHQAVIALTALVIKGDKERCLAAGMDGYLSKPIRQHELDEILESHTIKCRAAMYSSENSERGGPDLREPNLCSEIPETREEVRARFSLNEAELMGRIGGDLEFLAELTEVLRQEYPKQLSAARKAAADRDGAALNKAGHALRGALANLAATDPAAVAASIELIGATGDPSTAAVLIDQLERDIERVVISLESLCHEPAG